MRKLRRQKSSPLDHALATRDRNVLQMVEAALRSKQVMLAYQPVMQARAPDNTAFYEGLIRLMDETGRIIPAREFIGEIEELELGRIMDCLALEKGLRTLARQPELRLSINMSARSIGYPRWMRTLRQGISKNATIAERLILEITESSAMTVPELVISFMNEFQSKGVSFALDDFGAGFTSFRYLRDFYFDILKIDGQFIRGIAANPDNQVLTAALISIARQFDMLTVAEFVETESDATFLTELGVDCLQGYYFAAPTVRPHWSADKEAQARSA